MNLLSYELIQNGIDAYLGQFPTVSRKIYLLVIGFVVLDFVALPLIEIVISVQDAGNSK